MISEEQKTIIEAAARFVVRARESYQYPENLPVSVKHVTALLTVIEKLQKDNADMARELSGDVPHDWVSEDGLPF